MDINTDRIIQDNEFILFVCQEANFQSRSMLVPAKEYLNVRQNDYNILKKHALKCVPFKINNDLVFVNQLIKLNSIWDNNRSGKQEKTEYTQICNDLCFYCDLPDDDMYLKETDKSWLQRSVMGICSQGFNHVKNYITCQKKLKEDPMIVLYDSFLILETENGKIRFSPYDTVEELQQFFYQRKINKQLVDHETDCEANIQN
jgi:hypothetical protein